MRVPSFLHVIVGLIATPALSVIAASPSDSGALDSSFGSGGKVQLNYAPYNQPAGASLVANAMVVQPDGKILLAGYAASSTSEWIVVRLNPGGSYDSSFGANGNGIVYVYAGGTPDNQAASIALRPNGSIVVGGTILDGNNGLVTAVVVQLNSNGSFDTAWGDNGQVYFTPAGNDATRTQAIVLDTVDTYALGNLYVVGQYTHSGSPTCNNFFYAGISVDGHTKVSNSFQASEDCNVSESATRVAVQPGTGNIIIGGYSAFVSGSPRCSAISTVILPSPVFPAAYVYTGWGSKGVISFTVPGAQFPNDYCSALTINPDGSMAIGGYGTATTTGGTYQAAVLALYDSSGTLEQHESSGIGYPDLYAFDYNGGNLIVGNGNAMFALLPEPYDGKLIAAGFNDDPHNLPPTGDNFAIVRLDAPIYTNFSNDPSFNGGKSVLIDWGSYQIGTNHYTSNDRVLAAAFDPQGRLMVAGYASDPAGGSDLAVARFAPFDGIFKGRFETLAY